MVLRLRVLGPLSEGAVSSFEFYAGEDRSLTLQLIDNDSGDPISIPTGAVKTLTLSGTPTDISVVDANITINSEDPSIFSVTLSDSQTSSLQSGEVKFSYTVGSTTRIATLKNGLKKLITSL